MKSTILIESKTARQEYISKASILDLMKPAVPVLTKDGHSTIKQVAGWYRVSADTVKKILSRNKEEFSVDNIKTISRTDIQKIDFCEGQNVPSKVRVMTLLPKQAILRIGMLLTESSVATKVRDLLIAGEQQLSFQQKTRTMRQAEKWQIEREASKKIRHMTTDAIKGSDPSNKWVYKNYTNLIYKTIFGKDAKQLKGERGAKSNDNLRDGFTGEELIAIQSAEFTVAGLVEAGLTYHEIKVRIQNRDFFPKATAI